MKRPSCINHLLAALIFFNPLFLHAAAPLHGREALRELVIFPDMSLVFQYGFSSQGVQWYISGVPLEDQILETREQLKPQPDDIEKMLHLAYLLDSNQQKDEAASCWRTVEQSCRDRTAVQPQNGLVFSELGEALDNLNKDDEAEAALRRSVVLSSNDWHCWARLGSILLGRSYALLTLPEGAKNDPAAYLKKIVDYRPSPDAIATSQKLAHEADDCYARTTTLASNNAEMWLVHGGYLIRKKYADLMIESLHGRKTIGEFSMEGVQTMEPAIPDLYKAAALETNNPVLIAIPVYFDVAMSMVKQPAALDSNVLFGRKLDSLPERVRTKAREALTRLENLSQSPDKKIAVEALESHSLLLFGLGNIHPAVADAKRAVALEPASDLAWNILLGFSTASDDELLALTEQRLKAKETVFNHLILAKMCVRLKNWDKARAQTDAALYLDPMDIRAHMLDAALLLRQVTDDDSLIKAATALDKVKTLLGQMPSGEDQKLRQHEYWLNLIIQYTLTDYPQNNKEAIDAIDKNLPNDPTAKKIRGALE